MRQIGFYRKTGPNPISHLTQIYKTVRNLITSNTIYKKSRRTQTETYSPFVQQKMRRKNKYHQNYVNIQVANKCPFILWAKPVAQPLTSPNLLLKLGKNSIALNSSINSNQHRKIMQITEELRNIHFL